MLLLPVRDLSGPRMQLMISNPHNHSVRQLETGIILGNVTCRWLHSCHAQIIHNLS